MTWCRPPRTWCKGRWQVRTRPHDLPRSSSGWEFHQEGGDWTVLSECLLISSAVLPGVMYGSLSVYMRGQHDIKTPRLGLSIVNTHWIQSWFFSCLDPPGHIRHRYRALLEYNTPRLPSHTDAEISVYHYPRHCGAQCKNSSGPDTGGTPLDSCQFERNKSSSYLCFASRQLVTRR